MCASNDYPAIALEALQKAWTATAKDYDLRRLNSERCVQASIYHHLRRKLKRPEFTIYIEPYLSIGDAKPCYLDMLVAHGGNVVLALELKYKPNSKPSRRSVAADLSKLVQLKNRRASADQTGIHIGRFLSEKTEKLTLGVAPRSIAVFAAYVKEGAFPTTRKSFWAEHREVTVGSNGRVLNSMPNRLVTLIAATKIDGKASAVTWAKPKTALRLGQPTRSGAA